MSMRIMVESLKRLYDEQKVEQQTVDNMLQAGKLTEEEYNYVLS